jgi:hypothetical protein
VSDDPDIDAVAAAGRELRDRRAAEDAARTAKADAKRAAEDQKERQRILWWSCSWGGVFKSALGWYYLFLFCGFVLAPITVIAFGWIRPSPTLAKILFPGAKKVIPVPTVIAGVLIWWWATTAAHRGLRKERQWIAALPFQLTGYEECLGDSPGDNRYLELRFTFAGEAPPDQTLLDVLSGDGGAWALNPQNGQPARDPGIDPGYRNYEHNRRVHKWFHALVEHQLAPLHRRYPFTALHVANSRSRY